MVGWGQTGSGLLLWLWACAAAAAPAIGPERSLAYQVTVPASANQKYPSCAFDGANHLVVWSDLRNGANAQIFAARVTPTGTVLDPTGFPVWPSDDDELWPTLSFDGQNYLVAWTESGSTTRSVRAVRLAPSGVRLDATPLVLSTAGIKEAVKSLYAGGVHLVMWESFSGTTGYDLSAQRVSPAGTLIGGTIAVTTATDDQTTAALAWDGSAFFAVWQDKRGADLDIYSTPIQVDGTVVAPAGRVVFAAPGDQEEPAVSFDGTNFLVTWDDAAAGATSSLRSSFISPAGAVVSGPFVLWSSAENPTAPVSIFAGTNHVVAWDEQNGSGAAILLGRRVAPNGTLVDASALTFVDAPWTANTALCRGTQLMVVTETWDLKTNQDLVATLVMPNGTAAPHFYVAFSADAQVVPRAAFDGTRYFVTFIDAPTLEVRTSRLDVAGQELSPSAVNLVPGGTNIRFLATTVGWGNLQVIVDDPGLFNALGLVRVDGTGTVLGTTDLVTGPDGADGPTAAWDGTRALVVWEDWRTPPGHDLYAQRFDSTGAPLDGNGVQLIGGNEDARRPSLAFDGTRFLLAWEQSIGSAYEIHAVPVTAQGAISRLDPMDRVLSMPGGRAHAPAVAASAQGFFVVWEDEGVTSDVRGTLVLGSGATLNPGGLAVAAGPGDERAPSIAFMRDTFFVAWEDGLAIRGTTVSRDGSVLDVLGTTISSGTSQQLGPHLAAGPPGEALLTYYAYDPAPALQSHRVRTRIIALDAPDGGFLLPDGGLSVRDAGEQNPNDGGQSSADGGTTATGYRLAVGCGCAGGGGEAGLLAAMLLLALVVAPRRRF